MRIDREDTAQGRGRGILLYTRTGLVVTKIENIVAFTQYCCFKVNDVTFYLIYQSPNSTDEDMRKLVELVQSVKKDSVLLSDFNLPEIDWQTGEAGRRSQAFLEAVDDHMLEQLVDFATHIKGNCLDLVLTNIPERVVEIMDTGRLGSSDHEMISILIQVGQIAQPTKRVKNWRKADWEGMRADMKKVDWQSELSGLRQNVEYT